MERFDRETLEADILTVARDKFVQRALQGYAKAIASDHYAVRHSTIASAANHPKGLKQELERGLQAILSASCDKRLETFHWMIKRLERERSASDVLDCVFDEAESQMNEAESPGKEVIGSVFGVGSSI